MTRDPDRVAEALLHEGYLLYPYRPSALKNQHRYPFGTLYPENFCRAHEAGDRSSVRLRCVALGPPEAQLAADLRFLQFPGTEGVVRTVHVAGRPLGELAPGHRTAFAFDPVAGEIVVEALPAGAGRWRVDVRLANLAALPDAAAASRDDALRRALASAHVLLSSDGGEFVSLIDPPPELADLAAGCRNDGLWPVLVGTPGRRDLLLAAPIILYDYPELAPESPGDFFDGTEIDELLTLRVLTLTDDEKRELASNDARARSLLERTEAAGLERLGRLHGRLRSERPLRAGDAVRLRPRPGADIMDLALAGKHATVQAVERDLEGRTYVAVTIDDDPGKDLGVHGHRFFFRPEEVEPA